LRASSLAPVPAFYALTLPASDSAETKLHWCRSDPASNAVEEVTPKGTWTGTNAHNELEHLIEPARERFEPPSEATYTGSFGGDYGSTVTPPLFESTIEVSSVADAVSHDLE